MSSLNLRPRHGRRLPRRIVLFRSPHQFRLGWRMAMKRLVPIPCGCAEHLKSAEETGIGYQVVSVQLKDEKIFEEVVSVNLTHQHWNFRDQSDTRAKSRAATA